MKGDKTIDKSDKDYVFDSLIECQEIADNIAAIVDDLVEYMEDDDTYDEEDNKRNIWEELVEFLFLFWWWVLVWIILQATFNLLQQL